MPYPLLKTPLPINRIKTIMNSSPDVLEVEPEAMFLISKATELFVSLLARESFPRRDPNCHSLDYKHVSKYVLSKEAFQFLQDILPKKLKASVVLKMIELNLEDPGELGEEDESSAEGSSESEDEIEEGGGEAESESSLDEEQDSEEGGRVPQQPMSFAAATKKSLKPTAAATLLSKKPLKHYAEDSSKKAAQSAIGFSGKKGQSAMYDSNKKMTPLSMHNSTKSVMQSMEPSKKKMAQFAVENHKRQMMLQASRSDPTRMRVQSSPRGSPNRKRLRSPVYKYSLSPKYEYECNPSNDIIERNSPIGNQFMPFRNQDAMSNKERISSRGSTRGRGKLLKRSTVSQTLPSSASVYGHHSYSSAIGGAGSVEDTLLAPYEVEFDMEDDSYEEIMSAPSRKTVASAVPIQRYQTPSNPKIFYTRPAQKFAGDPKRRTMLHTQNDASIQRQQMSFAFASGSTALSDDSDDASDHNFASVVNQPILRDHDYE